MRDILIIGLNTVFAIFYAAIFIFIYAAFHHDAKEVNNNEETRY